MHIFFTVYMCKCTHIFCICICWHTDICLKHIYTCNIYVYSCLLACFWSCLSFMILYVHFFFYFSFLRKKSSFFCYPFFGWQHWALIKKNYSWSCSCYPLCEIINDFIDRTWWHILFLKCLWFKNLFIHFHMLRKGWRIVWWEEPLETERRCVHADVRCSSQWMSTYCTTLS